MTSTASALHRAARLALGLLLVVAAIFVTTHFLPQTLLVRCLQLAQNGKVAFEITIQCGLLLEQLRDLLVDGADPLAHLVDTWSAA